MRLLTLKQVVDKTGWKKTKIYDMIKAEKFPKQIKLGKSSRWLESDIDNWISEQIALHQ